VAQEFERNTGFRLQVDLVATNMPVGEETKYGADLGLRLSVKSYNATIVKGVLVQAKRMRSHNGQLLYPELKGQGERQARDMLRVTPAAVFFCYNFGDQRDLLQHVLSASRWPVLLRDLVLFANGDEWDTDLNDLWDMGIAVVPANYILALSASAQARNVTMPTDAPTILGGSVPLGFFVTDLLGSCFVGDPRESVVRLCTAPALRDKLFPDVGLESDPFRGFAVRHMLDVRLTQLP
jgi:hypothetical protein